MLQNTSVQSSSIRYGLPREGSLRPGEERSVLSWIGDQLVPSGDIFGQVLDPIGCHCASLRLSYADDDTLVWRTPDLPGDHYFVMCRGERDMWPAMDELRRREETSSSTSSPIGSAFALGMLNPFFSRRARP